MNDSQMHVRFCPASLFSITMGLAGLAIAWQAAGEAFGGVPTLVGDLLAWLTAAVLLALTVVYGAKLVAYRPAVLKELHNPVAINFFPAFSISLILLAVALLPSAAAVSFWLWLVGTVLHLAMTLYVMSAWMHHTHFEIHHSSPAWFIPVVGNILVPIAGVMHAPAEVSWFFFSVGLVYWLVLLTIIFYRFFFHPPLADKLVPTFVILMAPPAAGFLAYTKLQGGLDDFGRILFHAALFLFLLLLAQYRVFTRLQFFLSWWAYSFPLAALTIATTRMHALTGLAFFKVLALALLAFLSLVLVVLVVRTLKALAARKLCVPEG